MIIINDLILVWGGKGKDRIRLCVTRSDASQTVAKRSGPTQSLFYPYFR